jgi:murein DD-endopeptidase MepM/ murein hydrolase activator NlpD
VVEVEDGHYDRCHASIELGDVSCDGYEMKSNHVVIEHEDYAGLTLRTEYHHMMKGSPVVTVGMTVSCGQRLGRIGSSGRSSMPHVHLNVRRGGQLVDPYAGPASQPQTLWREQPSDPMVLPPASCLP